MHEDGPSTLINNIRHRIYREFDASELVRDGERRGGVERVVLAGHRQDEILHLHPVAGATVADHHPEAALPAAQVHV